VRWTAVVNPTAGRGRTKKLLPRLRSALEAVGVSVHVAGDLDDSLDTARRAVDRGEGVVACGGDGTVSELAAIVADGCGVLGIVPTGAGNDFARHLGIDPRQPLAAVDALTAGRVGAVDLGLAQSADGIAAVFTTVANTGFDADANRWANDVRWATGVPLYVAAMLRTLAAYRPQPLRVSVDGVTWEGDAWLAAVANTRYYAGGMMIAPGAEVDDGALDVCIVRGTSTAELLMRFPRVYRGTHVGLKSVVTMRGSLVELESVGGDRPMEVWASGERIGPLPASIELQPGALQVALPSGAPVHLT
jgi:diacylglycerol kinase (ATP)